MRLILVLSAVVIVGALGFWFLTDPSLQRAGTEPIPAGQPDLANGQTLFYAGGCASCHATPGQDDKTRLGGGFALASGFGTFYAPNISPHPRDGIGGWTPEQFLRAMRGGVSPDGRHYYPSFPYTSYQRMACGGRARRVRLHPHASAGRGPRPRARPAARLHLPPRPRPVEARFPRRQKRSHRMPRKARPGIAAPTSSKGRAIAPNATARATSPARSTRTAASPAAPIRMAKGRCRTSRRIRAESAIGPERRRRGARLRHDPGGRFRRRQHGVRWCATPRRFRRRIATPWPNTSCRCRRARPVKQRRKILSPSGRGVAHHQPWKWCTGPWPRPIRKCVGRRERGGDIGLGRAPRRRQRSSPLARPAAIADDSVQPVPCVLRVAMRGAAKRSSARRRRAGDRRCRRPPHGRP